MTAFSLVQNAKAVGLLSLLGGSTLVHAIPPPAVCVSNTAYVDSAGYTYNLLCASDTTTAAFVTQNIATGDFTSCFSLCDTTPTCLGFTWNPNNSGGGQCLLKKNSPAFQSGAGGQRKVAALLVSQPSSPVSTSTVGLLAIPSIQSVVSSVVSAVIGPVTSVANAAVSFSCANDDGHIRTDGAGVNYRISCSADTMGAAYNTYTVSNGFNDCFAFCDNSQALDGQTCTAFTFASDSHLASGVGSGTCSMKSRANQDFTSANTAHVAAIVTTQVADSGSPQPAESSQSSANNAASSVSTTTQTQSTSSASSSVLGGTNSATSSTVPTNIAGQTPYTSSATSQSTGSTSAVSQSFSIQSTGLQLANTQTASTSLAQILTSSVQPVSEPATSLGLSTLSSSDPIPISPFPTGTSEQNSVSSITDSGSGAKILTSSSLQPESSVLIPTSPRSRRPPGVCESGPVTNSDGVTYTITCDAHTTSGPYLSSENVPSGTYIDCSLACDDQTGCGAFEWIPDGSTGGTCYYKSPGQSVAPSEPGYVVGIREAAIVSIITSATSGSQETATSLTTGAASASDLNAVSSSAAEISGSQSLPPASASSAPEIVSSSDAGANSAAVSVVPSGLNAPGSSIVTSQTSSSDLAAASASNSAQSTANTIAANVPASSGSLASSNPNVGGSSSAANVAPSIDNPTSTNPAAAEQVSNSVSGQTSVYFVTVSTNVASSIVLSSTVVTFSAPPPSVFSFSSVNNAASGNPSSSPGPSSAPPPSTYILSSSSSPAGPPTAVSVIPVASIAGASSSPAVTTAAAASSDSYTAACPSTASSGSTDCVDDYGNPFNVTYGTIYQGRIAARVGRPNVGSCLRLCDEYNDCSAVNYVGGECQVLTDVTGSTGSSGGVGARRPRDRSTRIHVPPSTEHGGRSRTRTREHGVTGESTNPYEGNHPGHSRTRSRTHSRVLGPGPVSASVGGVIGHSHTRSRTRTRGGGGGHHTMSEGGGEPGMDHSRSKTRSRTRTHGGAGGSPSASEAGGEPGMGHSRTRSRTRTRMPEASSVPGQAGTTASGYPSKGVLCPNYDGQQYTDKQGESYRIHCEASYTGSVIFSSDYASEALDKRTPNGFTARSCLAYCDQVDECVGINFSCDNVCTLFGDLKHLVTTDQCGLGAKRVSAPTSSNGGGAGNGNGNGNGEGGSNGNGNGKGGNVITVSVCKTHSGRTTKTRTKTKTSVITTVTIEPTESEGYGGVGAGKTHQEHTKTKTRGQVEPESTTRSSRTRTKGHTPTVYESTTRAGRTKTKGHTPPAYESATGQGRTRTKGHTPAAHETATRKQHTKTKLHTIEVYPTPAKHTKVKAHTPAPKAGKQHTKTKGRQQGATGKKHTKTKAAATRKHSHQKPTTTARQPAGVYQLKAAKKKKPVFKHFFGHLGP